MITLCTSSLKPKVTALSRVAELLDQIGYELSPWRPESWSETAQHENRTHLIHIAIAGFLAANAMWIAVALYAGAASESQYFLMLVGTLLGLLSVIGPGRVFLLGAVAALKNWTPHMDMPVALGLLVATVVSLTNAVLGTGDVYFDSVSALVFLLLIGRWLKFRQQLHASSAVDLMLRILPRSARRIKTVPTVQQAKTMDLLDSSSEEVSADSLAVDDWIEVYSGECLPADGLLRAVPDAETQDAKLDCSLLTGESKIVRRKIGEQLYAGAINVGSKIVMCVNAVGSRSRVGKVMNQVESAASERVPIVMLADRLGGFFVVIVSVLAVLTFLVWLPSGFSKAAACATALLIVACPCALALATPLALATAIGRAANRGILIRDGSVFQRMSRTGALWLDKTGTLTTGKQQVTSVYGCKETLRLAAMLERDCAHPVARAIQQSVSAERLDGAKPPLLKSAPELQQLQTFTDGRRGTVEGINILIGNLKRIEQENCEMADDYRRAVHAVTSSSASPCLIARENVVVTVLGISDPVASGVENSIAKLRSRGWKIGVLSGDDEAIVKRVGTSLGIEPDDCRGGMTPEEKLAVIQQSKKDGEPTIMVGDGANDAAALAAADVGIAVRGGAEASLMAAPVILRGGIGKLDALLSAARRTQFVIVLTFLVSLTYNLIAVTGAILGWISPLVAAVFMPLSSLSVLTIVLAHRTFLED